MIGLILEEELESDFRRIISKFQLQNAKSGLLAH